VIRQKENVRSMWL